MKRTLIIFAFLGTDILKKKLLEQNANGNGDFSNDQYDYGHDKLVPNHNPHNRSRLMMYNSDMDDLDRPPGSAPYPGLFPMNEVSPDGSPIRNFNTTDMNHLNVGGLNSSPENNVPNHSPHGRSPSLKIRRYSFLAGSRRGRGYSEILNSTILNDHFDQYTAQQIEGEGHTPDSHLQGNHVNNPPRHLEVSNKTQDSDNEKHLVRRSTMPSIVKEDEGPKSGLKETAHSSENVRNPETFIIENGIRKRVTGVNAAPTPSKSKGNLPNEFQIESQNCLTRSGGNRGSLPDIAAMKQKDKIKPMSREEAFKLSTKRREELRKLQELAERRRQGDVTVILGDLRVRTYYCNARSLIDLYACVSSPEL